MKKPIFKPKKSKLDEEIDKRIDNLGLTLGSEEDSAAIQNVKDLVDIKGELCGPKQKINPNTVITAVGSLIGILLIIYHEQVNVVSSKAMGIATKLFK